MVVDLRLRYGRGEQVASVAHERVVAVVGRTGCGGIPDVTTAVEQALSRPAGPPLESVVRRGERVLLITVDHTRPSPVPMLRPLMERVRDLGAEPALMVALGNHRPMSQAELAAFLGTPHVAQNDARSPDQWRLGHTRHGTPIEVSPRLQEANRRILVGYIEPHYIAGFSGGRKMILPGCASFAATTRNHFLTLLHGPQLGRLDGNPVHEDMLDAALAVGVDWICNAVVTADDRIHSVHCGDLQAAHQEGAAAAEALYSCTLPERADIVICSPGGWPYDMDMVQTKKALAPALECVRPGGVIILVGECERGWGAYEPDWDLLRPQTAPTAREAIADSLRAGHLDHRWPPCSPGLLFMRAVYDTPAQVIVVSSLGPQLGGTYLKTAGDLEEALRLAETRVGMHSTITVLYDGRRALCRVAAD